MSGTHRIESFGWNIAGAPGYTPRSNEGLGSHSQAGEDVEVKVEVSDGDGEFVPDAPPHWCLEGLAGDWMLSRPTPGAR